MDPTKPNRALSRIALTLILLAVVIFASVQLRKFLFASGRSSAQHKIGFVGDSVLGVGASKKSPYYFLRTLLENEDVNAINFSEAALSALRAQAILARSTEFSNIDTFVLMLGLSERLKNRYDRDLKALKPLNIKPESFQRLIEIATLISTGENGRAEKELQSMLTQESDPNLQVFLKIWIFGLSPKPADFPAILQTLDALSDAPQRFYYVLSRTLRIEKLFDENAQVLERIRSRYGPSPTLTTMMAWQADRHGCSLKGLDLFEEAVQQDDSDLDTFRHFWKCYAPLQQTKRQTEFLEKLKTNPKTANAYKLFSQQKHDPASLVDASQMQLYFEELYQLEKKQQWTEQAERFLNQSKDEGEESLHQSESLARLVEWLIEKGKTVIYVTYPNDVLPATLENFSNPRFQVLNTKNVYRPYLDKVTVTQILDDDYQHLSTIGACLLGVELARQLVGHSSVTAPLTWCEAQR